MKTSEGEDGRGLTPTPMPFDLRGLTEMKTRALIFLPDDFDEDGDIALLTFTSWCDETVTFYFCQHVFSNLLR